MEDLETLRSLYQQRRFSEAVGLYQKHRSSRNPEWHLYGSLAAMGLEDWYIAKAAAERAASLRATGPLRLRIRFQYGNISRLVGDYAVAMQEFDACLSVLNRTPSLRHVMRGPVHFQRALVLIAYGKQQAAMRAFELAAKEFEREHLSDSLRQCLQNLAWLACDTKNLKRAKSALRQAAPLCTTEEAIWHQRLGHAYVAYRKGERTEALHLCSWIQQGRNVPTNVRCLAACIASNIAADMDLPCEAHHMAQVAVDLAFRRPNDSRCVRTASRVMSRVQRMQASRSGENG